MNKSEVNMTTDMQIRREALRLHFKEGKDFSEVCREIKATFGVVLYSPTVRKWVIGKAGQLYKDVNCAPVLTDSIQRARDQERRAQKDLLGDILGGA